MKTSSVVAVVFLLLVSVSHLLRVIFGASITVNALEIPMWPSIAAFVFTAVLAVWLWKDSRKKSV